jgi:hypothetical protein
MSPKLTRILNFIDIIGNPFLIKYKNHTTAKTPLGGCLSLAIICFLLYTMVYFSQDLFQRTKPFIRYIKFFSSDQKVVLKDFPIFFNILSNAAVSYNNPEYFTITPVYFELVIDPSTSMLSTKISNLFAEPCDPLEHLPEQYRDFVLDPKNNVPFSSSQCLNPRKIQWYNGKLDNNYTLFIQNDWAVINSKWVYLEISKCDRTHQKCAKEEEIEKVLSGADINVQVYYIDNYLDLNDYSKPNKLFFSTQTTAISSGFLKLNNMRIKNTYIKTDDGMVIENNNDQEIYQVESMKNDILVHNTKLYGLNLENPRVKDQFYRKYVKIQDLIASIGGTIKFLITASILLNSFYSSKQFIFNLSNEYFVENRLYITPNNEISAVSKNNFFIDSLKTTIKKQVPTNFDVKDYIFAKLKKKI